MTKVKVDILPMCKDILRQQTGKGTFYQKKATAKLTEERTKTALDCVAKDVIATVDMQKVSPFFRIETL